MSEHESGSTALPAVREPDMVRLAEDLVASANDRGIALTGEGGLLTDERKVFVPIRAVGTGVPGPSRSRQSPTQLAPGVVGSDFPKRDTRPVSVWAKWATGWARRSHNVD